VRKQHLSKALESSIHFSMIQSCSQEKGLLHSLTTHTLEKDISVDLEQLLLEFEDIFNEPMTLPPLRGRHDH